MLHFGEKNLCFMAPIYVQMHRVGLANFESVTKKIMGHGFQILLPLESSSTTVLNLILHYFFSKRIALTPTMKPHGTKKFFS